MLDSLFNPKGVALIGASGKVLELTRLRVIPRLSVDCGLQPMR